MLKLFFRAFMIIMKLFVVHHNISSSMLVLALVPNPTQSNHPNHYSSNSPRPLLLKSILHSHFLSSVTTLRELQVVRGSGLNDVRAKNRSLC
mmetsp:Transcript_8706/g.19540  ORF Transcript_8706/g.19540 Transcript_8706/m.19540 type:complete len:92 (+) Transcript_8706:855-1130(+)